MYTSIDKDIKFESLRLFKNYQQFKNPDLRNQLVRLNIGLVKKEAYHWSNRSNESYEDLLQVGSLGLIGAIERFEPARGHAFSSFAIPYIRGEIQHYLRDHGSSVKIPRRWQELKYQAEKVIRDFREHSNRQPTDAEIARQLQISISQWQEIKLAHQNQEPLSLDLPVGDEEEGKVNLADLVPDPQYRSFQLAQEDRIRLQQALAQLEECTRYVLEFIFLHDLTQKETAERLGVSVITVARRVKKGLGFLKKAMGQE